MPALGPLEREAGAVLVPSQSCRTCEIARLDGDFGLLFRLDVKQAHLVRGEFVARQIVLMRMQFCPAGSFGRGLDEVYHFVIAVGLATGDNLPGVRRPRADRIVMFFFAVMA